jgi:DUF4097 and DUF4098 domain-containing protein YvlB
MIQQIFPVTTHRPRIVISRVEGNLNIQPWENQEIGVEIHGAVEVLNQEGDTLTITNSQGDLFLWIPSIPRFAFAVTTDLIATDICHNATVVKAGNVTLNGVGGNAIVQDIHGYVELVNIHDLAELTNVGGNLRVAHIEHLYALHIGGNTVIVDTALVELCAVGGNLAITSASSVNCSAVGGDLDAERVESQLQCNTVGGNCAIHHCAGAEVNVHTVGGNFTCDGAAQIASHIVGGNLRLRSGFQAGSQVSCHVGGNASITLPDDANLSLSATVGGSASSSGVTYVRGGGFVNLVYGDASARLGLTVGGNLKLSGPEPCKLDARFSWDDFGREMVKLSGDISLDVLQSFDEF